MEKNIKNGKIYDKKAKYVNILNRIQKKISIKECIFIIIRLYLTNNICYYFLCILFRLITLFIISGDYYTSINQISSSNNRKKTFGQYIRLFTIHNLIIKLQISDIIYICISLLIFILFLIRIIIYYSIIKNLDNYNYINKWPLPGKYFIIIDHIIFLFFPYIIEFLSFSYYIYFFPEDFIIKYNNHNNILLFIIIVLNTILIIVSNLNNYILIKCSNKVYTINEYEAFSKMKKISSLNEKNCISFKLSSLSFSLLIILQNFALFQTLEYYINNNIIYFKTLISIILFLIILVLLYERINVFNYNNFINNFINISIIFFLYSILIDILLYIYHYKIKSLLDESIYIIFKILLSCITHEIIILKTNKFLEKSIRKILFKEKTITKKLIFSDALIYLNELMLKLKENNNSNNKTNLIIFLDVHIKECK